MNKEQQDKLPLQITSVLAIVSVALGAFLYDSSLKSDRPGDIRIERSAIVGQQILARLWEDPFEAIVRHRTNEDADPKSRNHVHSLEKLQQQIWSDPQPITLIAVMVDSDPYAEGKEQRLRKRYAVLSALGEAGYVPLDGEHIDYFDTGENVNVPYEWYELNTIKHATGSQRDRKVLIVWLRDDWAYQHSGATHCSMMRDGHGGFLHDMATLICNLRSPSQTSETFHVRILGPGVSRMVRQWIDELTNLVNDRRSVSALYVKRYLQDAKIYSYSATADPAVLYSGLESPARLDKNGEASQFRELEIQFERTISTDRELAEALVVELQQRGVDLPTEKANADHHDHIAIIAEWDTFYGRALPLTFMAAAQERATRQAFADVVKELENQGSFPENRLSDPDDLHKWIHSYAYLRGLDGVTDGKSSTGSEKKEKDSKKPGNDTAPNRFDTAYLERPEGQSQLDYIRRLAMAIERDNEQLKRRGTQFRAIGVLGSDVYDKLLILQALRKTFSNVIFFTTDLDARLAHPAVFDWSRNLVVASAYGLELNSFWQTETPPFRSSYQTALFLSTLKALGTSVAAPSEADVPRLYEIGRRGAVELPQGSVFQVAGDILRRSGWLSSQNTVARSNPGIHPLPLPVLAKPLTVLGVMVVSTLLACMVVIITQCYATPSRQFSARDILRYLIVFLVVPFLLYVFVQVQYEPFSLFDGISIWPTEIIRIIVILLSVYFLWQAKGVLEEGDRKIAGRFCLKLDPIHPSNDRNLPWWRNWQHLTTRLNEGMPLKSTAVEKVSVDAVLWWKNYLKETQCGSRLTRVAGLMALALVLAVVIMSLFDAPFVPVRGTISLWSDRLILLLAILVTNTLLFAVLDASLLAARTIRKCIESIPVWSPASLQTYAGKGVTLETNLQAQLTIQFIGMLTGVVGKLIYYPFIAVALLLAARSRYFDNWDFPLGLLIIFSLNLTYALASAFILRREAERARAMALEQVQAPLIRVEGGKELSEDEVEQITRTIEEIRMNREGAFASFLYQPAFGASLIPTSGITLLALLEYFVPGK